MLALMQITCTPRMFCAAYGLSEPNGTCDAGYYCVGGAETSSPTDGATGKEHMLTHMYVVSVEHCCR